MKNLTIIRNDPESIPVIKRLVEVAREMLDTVSKNIYIVQMDMMNKQNKERE